MVEKKVGSKKVGEKNQKIKKKRGVEKSKQAVVEVASELLFVLALFVCPPYCLWTLVWPRSKMPRNTTWPLMTDKSWYMLNMGQNKLLGEAHSYKWLISIFEEVASELLFGLVLKCPWNGTDFFLIFFTLFNRVVFPYDFWQKKFF